MLQGGIRNQAPIIVLSPNTEREHGSRVQIANINAAKVSLAVDRLCKLILGV